MIHARDPEYRIQTAFIRYVDLVYPELLFTIAPAGFIMNQGMAMKMSAMGYRKGTPDLLFFEPRGSWHGLLIEFKAPGKKTSPEQVSFCDQAEKRGYKTAVCYSSHEAIQVLEVYLM